MRLVFFGPPGSGKGTQAKLIANEFNICHLSTGEILREKLKDEDEIAKQLKKIMSSGNLVSDNLLNNIITKKIKSIECNQGFILDGYPRTVAQSDFLLSFLDKNNLILDFILDFKVDFKVVEDRIIQRSQNEKRSDDNAKVIKTRLNKYMQETFPVSLFFKDIYTSKYISVDASQEILHIQNDLLNLLKKVGK